MNVHLSNDHCGNVKKSSLFSVRLKLHSSYSRYTVVVAIAVLSLSLLTKVGHVISSTSNTSYGLHDPQKPAIAYLNELIYSSQFRQTSHTATGQVGLQTTHTCKIITFYSCHSVFRPVLNILTSLHFCFLSGSCICLNIC